MSRPERRTDSVPRQHTRGFSFASTANDWVDIKKVRSEIDKTHHVRLMYPCIPAIIQYLSTGVTQAVLSTSSAGRRVCK
jgi:hypothetical protein